jgi:hypothetical protein
MTDLKICKDISLSIHSHTLPRILILIFSTKKLLPALGIEKEKGYINANKTLQGLFRVKDIILMN